MRDIKKTVKNNEIINGVYRFNNQQAITMYEKINNDYVLFLGKYLISDAFVDFLNNYSIDGKGYFFILSEDGAFDYHKFKERMKSNIKEYPFGQDILNEKNGIVNYEFNGDKYTFVKYLPNEKLYMCYGLTKEELYFGLDKEIYKSMIISGSSSIIISLIITFFVIKMIKRILNLSVKSAQEISNGNYDFRVEYETKDIMRTLFDAQEKMALDIKNQIEEVKKQTEEANEQKKKAEEALATVEIKSMEIENKNKQMEEVAEEAKKISETIASASTELSAQVEQVSTGAEEQSAASEQINKSVMEVNRVSQETADAMVQSSQAVSDLARLAENLDLIISKLKG